MKRTLKIATAVIAGWVLISFAGTMLDFSRAEFWTQSLMWSLLATLLVVPMLVLLTQQASAPVAEETRTAQTLDTRQPQPESFAGEEADRMRTLWPEEGTETGRKQHA